MAMRNSNGEGIRASVPDNAFNVWGDDYIQSMRTPYGDSEYRERAEALVKEVKVLLREMQSGDGDGDIKMLTERLEMVDALQCLGIDRYFDAEIKLFLDSAFRCWDTSVGIRLGLSRDCNLNATALGLRLLRLRRYDVSPDVLEGFKDKDGHFFFFAGESNGRLEEGDAMMMRGMLNLLRASSVAFPGETVMEEAKIFTSACLKTLLQTSRDAYNASFLKEVEYALVYDFSCTFPRWEARNFIEIYELDDRRPKDKRILELARLDFSILQFTYKMEMKNLSKWWVNSEIPKIIAMRDRLIEYFFWGVSTADEVDLSSTRISIAKISNCATLLDDLIDDYATYEQLQLFKEVIVQGWDVSIVANMPPNFKFCLEFIVKTVHEVTNEATKRQGRDMMPFITKAWEDYVEASLEQERWKASGYIPTYNEYMKAAMPSTAMGPIMLPFILLAGPILNNDSIQKIFLNQSRFYELIWTCIRLIDDARDFQDEKRHGETATAISSYMRDNPECSEEQALSHITNLIDELLKELKWIYLNPNSSLFTWEKACFDFNRGLQFLYIYGDGLTYSDKEVKDQVFKLLVDPIVV